MGRSRRETATLGVLGCAAVVALAASGITALSRVYRGDNSCGAVFYDWNWAVPCGHVLRVRLAISLSFLVGGCAIAVVVVRTAWHPRRGTYVATVIGVALVVAGFQRVVDPIKSPLLCGSVINRPPPHTGPAGCNDAIEARESQGALLALAGLSAPTIMWLSDARRRQGRVPTPGEDRA
jgi:hypothetical protein